LVAGLLLIGALCALPFVAAPDGAERWPLAQFFGRFHPVLVHLPIGLLVVVPVLELFGLISLWSHLQKSAGFILTLAAAGAVGATLAGWLLAWSGGYQGETVMNHLWGGIATSAASLYLVWARPAYLSRDSSALARLSYIPLLLTTVAAISWTSHQGSIITHGDDYLTKHMPPSIRLLFGVAPAPVPAAKPAAGVAAPSLYTTQIAPIFEKHCVACHKPSKHKANLRMDTYELLMTGGDSGPPVVAGSLEKSDLYRRITLPKDDEEFMPTDGKPALAPAEIKLIADWITAGAKP
jgi:uncharacterized membrane protein